MGGSSKDYEYSDIIERVVDFARLLRDRGVPCSPSEAVDAAKALIELGRGSDTELLREALRAALVKKREYYAVFDELFNLFWGGGPVSGSIMEPMRVRVVVEGEPLDPVKKFLSVYSPLEVQWGKLDIQPGSREKARVISRGVRLFRRRAALYGGRRWRLSSRGAIDFRLAMKESMKTMGEYVRLPKRRVRHSKSRIVALFDVSNSMKEEWGWLQSAIAAFRRLPSGSYEIFLFSTRLKRITEIVNVMDAPEEIGSLLARENALWGSGTRIGESLRALLDSYQGLLTRRTALVIVSDGWDLGDLELLERSLAEARRRTGFIAWFTPHMDKPGFTPSTACLVIASRYVDLLAPSSALEDVRLLTRIMALAQKHV